MGQQHSGFVVEIASPRLGRFQVSFFGAPKSFPAADALALSRAWVGSMFYQLVVDGLDVVISILLIPRPSPIRYDVYLCHPVAF
nr:unnamed protein product [Haemonchus contortus]